MDGFDGVDDWMDRERADRYIGQSRLSQALNEVFTQEELREIAQRMTLLPAESMIAKAFPEEK